MRYTQLVNFEVAAVCKYAPIHLFCPAHKRLENALRPQLDDEVIADSITLLYRDHGFRGLVGFHFYCEPMQNHRRMQKIIDMVKARVDKPRFLLWTNAREHIEKHGFDLSQFEHVHLSLYKEQSNEEHIAAARNVAVQCPAIYAHRQRDDLRAGPDRIPMLGHCMRPFLEMNVEYDGTVRMCCNDWRPDDHGVGNLKDVGIGEIVRRWREIRRKLFDNGTGRLAMSREAPIVCKLCSNKSLTIDGLEKQIAEESAKYAMSLLKEQGDVREQEDCPAGRLYGSGPSGENRDGGVV